MAARSAPRTPHPPSAGTGHPVKRAVDLVGALLLQIGRAHV